MRLYDYPGFPNPLRVRIALRTPVEGSAVE